MTCDELEAFLHPYLDGEFEPDDRLELENHLSACGPCARRLHEEARFREALHPRMRDIAEARTRAPETLRQRVQSGVRQEHQRQRRAVLLRYGAAAMVVLTASGTYLALRPRPSQPYVEDAARRHARPLPPEIQHASPEVVEQWLDGKLDHRVSVPRFRELAVRSARIANVKDRTAAYVTYEVTRDGGVRRVGLFVFSDSEKELGAMPLPKMEVGSSHGYNVAMWRDGEVVYELVSDLNEADIRRMVTEGSLPGRPPAPAPAPAPSELDVRPVSAH